MARRRVCGNCNLILDNWLINQVYQVNIQPAVPCNVVQTDCDVVHCTSGLVSDQHKAQSKIEVGGEPSEPKPVRDDGRRKERATRKGEREGGGEFEEGSSPLAKWRPVATAAAARPREQKDISHFTSSHLPCQVGISWSPPVYPSPPTEEELISFFRSTQRDRID
ncbi:hypothetical protein J6590_012264 [Homalodisca vitripennis]|nr:hypothetical protein J6590_012264 [Homalodisca vitripennis]